VSLHIFGIRHHGPGCARSLRAALQALQPDIILVEGPPDAQDVLPQIMHEEMQPPVALLIYRPDQPRHAVYYPFTHFSPEWQALCYAQEQHIPARFMDLPQAMQLAKLAGAQDSQEQTPPGPQLDNLPSETARTVQEPQGAEIETSLKDEERDDPLALLAQAAGYTDHELWWERQIEQRQNANDLFEGILEAMAALRDGTDPRNEEEAQREAYMRQCIRTAQKEQFQRIAVVCGAWHAPVLVNPASTKADTARLKGLKRVKTAATWIPWTNSRLAYRSGYGAGVTSPGWYEHLWSYPEHITQRWITRAAHLLRAEGMDASSASVIEAVRLAETLAALRDLSLPGLAEQHEAIKTVLCHGNDEPMSLIRDKLEIGEKLGQVPADTPVVPLQRDFEFRQRKVRLKPAPQVTRHDFDLRQELDRERSQFLYQLRLLDINWGKPERVGGQKAGTFHEYWTLQWQVEYTVKLIEANIWGNTVAAAASAFACQQADSIEELPQLTALLDHVILAELPTALNYLLQVLQKLAAVAADVRHLMDALPPLARIARYGNVRQTNAERITPVINSLFERIVIGMPGACSSLDDDTARGMVASIEHVQESVSLLNRADQRAEWQAVLRRLMEHESIHGFVRGLCCRLLLEQNMLDEAQLQLLAAHALSPVTAAPLAAAWIEGVLRGSGVTILHQDRLWRALDRWLSELTPEVFTAQLPILRRAFSDFQAPERRKMGEKIKNLYASNTSPAYAMTAHNNHLNQANADMVLPVLALIMGVTYNEH
jgi:hypothetical protein